MHDEIYVIGGAWSTASKLDKELNEWVEIEEMMESRDYGPGCAVYEGILLILASTPKCLSTLFSIQLRKLHVLTNSAGPIRIRFIAFCSVFSAKLCLNFK